MPETIDPTIKIIGSQRRQRIQDTEYILVSRPSPGEVIVKYLGHWELYHVNDHHAGYTLQIGRWGYEFVRDVPDPNK